MDSGPKDSMNTMPMTLWALVKELTQCSGLLLSAEELDLDEEEKRSFENLRRELRLKEQELETKLKLAPDKLNSLTPDDISQSIPLGVEYVMIRHTGFQLDTILSSPPRLVRKFHSVDPNVLRRAVVILDSDVEVPLDENIIVPQSFRDVWLASAERDREVRMHSNEKPLSHFRSKWYMWAKNAVSGDTARDTKEVDGLTSVERSVDGIVHLVLSSGKGQHTVENVGSAALGVLWCKARDTQERRKLIE